jgi:hypothetical protein
MSVEVDTSTQKSVVTSGSKRWRRVSLSERDWQILSWAHEQKFLTFDQVARWFPDGEPNPHRPPSPNPSPDTLRKRERPGNWYVAERLRKLVRFEVLERVQVYTEPAAALVPGRVGFDLLQGDGRGHGLARLNAIDWKNFVHDRTATDVRWTVQKKLGGKNWQSERVLCLALGSRQVPDAVVELGGRRIALEVELTKKSLARYVGIFERYLGWRSPRLDGVLYVVPDAGALSQIFSSVLPAVLEKRELWGIRQPDLSLFRFTSIPKLEERRVWWTSSTPKTPTAGEL